MTINSAHEAAKVKIGSRWTVTNEYHTAITDDILNAGEVEVYKLRHDGFVVTVTIIFGEGETDEFELYLFVHLFKHKPEYSLIRTIYDTPVTVRPGEELLIQARQASARIHWDYGTQDKTATVLVCGTCGRIAHELPSAEHELTSGYECDHCSIVSEYKKKQTGFKPDMFLFDELSLMEEKPVSKLTAFFNEEPLGIAGLIIGIIVMSVAIIAWDSLSSSYNMGYFAYLLYGLFLLSSVVCIVIDIIRTKNQTKRRIIE